MTSSMSKSSLGKASPKPNRLARLTAPAAMGRPDAQTGGPVRPKYASLTAGLLARKGEAVPATPYFASEALDLYARPAVETARAEPSDGNESGERENDRAQMSSRTKPITRQAAEAVRRAIGLGDGQTGCSEQGAGANAAETPAQTAQSQNEEAAAPAVPGEPGEPGLDISVKEAREADWHLRRLGVKVRKVERPAGPVARPETTEPRAAANIPVPKKPDIEADSDIDADIATDVVVPLQGGEPASLSLATSGVPFDDQAVRFEANLPATLFARLALAANRAGWPIDRLIAQALETHFDRSGVPRAQLFDPND